MDIKNHIRKTEHTVTLTMTDEELEVALDQLDAIISDMVRAKVTVPSSLSHIYNMLATIADDR